jgi:hypothetical protein
MARVAWSSGGGACGLQSLAADSVLAVTVVPSCSGTGYLWQSVSSSLTVRYFNRLVQFYLSQLRARAAAGLGAMARSGAAGWSGGSGPA